MTDEELKEKDRLVRSKAPGTFVTRGSGKVPENFWEMPRPNIPVDVMVRALLEDREQGR